MPVSRNMSYNNTTLTGHSIIRGPQSSLSTHSQNATDSMAEYCNTVFDHLYENVHGPGTSTQRR